MNFSVAFYDRHPIDPKARFDIHRTFHNAETKEEVEEVFVSNDKETIFIIPSPKTEEDKALLWAAEQTLANERALKEYIWKLESEDVDLYYWNRVSIDPQLLENTAKRSAVLKARIDERKEDARKRLEKFFRHE